MAGIQPLKAADPLAVGGHRLLGRLGAGGMGVVYLARSPGGALVALKVIRAEHAADHGFRVRFRREAEAAGRLTGRWVVPVTAAAAEEREPWLATAFVPGPSLAEAAALYGPLPPEAVRTLGARLAEALTEVHGAGLVHRDVKPGNVLLALDGPRLIDFGIARSTGATALTESDVVIGSPGYLSPEQAQARAGELGPPSDVFSLGCVLVYATTGRRPFGTGSAAAVLFRTVHEEPDLDGVPPELLGLLTRCLAKDPRNRPGAAEVREALGGDGGEPGGWLPGTLTRLVAERSAAVLTLPDPPPDQGTERTTVADSLSDAVPVADAATVTAAPTWPPASGPSRRRVLALASAAGVVAIGGGLAAWAASRPTGGGPGTGGTLPRYAVGLHADLSGRDKAAGRAQERGVRLAVADHNARDDRTFDLTLRVRDDRGDAKRAETVAGAFAADPEVYAVIGPTGVAGVEPVAARHEKALLPLVSVSSESDAVTTADTRSFFQLRPDGNSMSAGFVDFLVRARGARRTVLVDDRASGRASEQLMVDLAGVLPEDDDATTTRTVPADSDDFGPVAAASMSADAVVYCGTSPSRAARCARALSESGFRGTRMAREPVLQAPFVAEAGPAADGWAVVTTYVDPGELAPATGFVTAYRKRYGPRTGEMFGVEPYAVEAWDALNFIAQGMRELLAGTGVERGAMVSRLRSLTYEGLARTIAFDDSTNAFVFTNGLFVHEVRKGAPHFLGRYGEAK
ncbi:Serine/threonine-protein kinase AfsK [Streptomyces sp. S4.7]|uniref:bifunctional serine/threonine-protein kinase/ABC transporter substrate-binding protein n=1 Tax=Streptomyces sp. S4.7 TaxID=2705439 RepID=UPI0013987EAA|nr:bifunctional serine/threonine-protein kinase/ABC transporter substrate-binding protein [Streptomyces sp. S4.7]QHY98827.1 Serine/threonine-protein kinase AfsK [Streptomyces sp. S4.7]